MISAGGRWFGDPCTTSGSRLATKSSRTVTATWLNIETPNALPNRTFSDWPEGTSPARNRAFGLDP